MRIYERIIFIILGTAGFYFCERHGRKEGYEIAMQELEEDHLQKNHKTIKNCGTCIYSVQDMNTGHYECSNQNSFAYCDDISLDECCGEWERR